MRYTRLSLGLEPTVIARIDALRGDVPRERYLRRMVDTGLARSEEIKAADTFAVTRTEPPPRADDVTVAEKVNQAMEPMRKAAAQLTRPRTHETVLDHEWVGTGPRCIRFGCPDPKNKEAHR